tara:strand:- start:1065 stop:3857 length:2793 start_codon:yes stop_codon:yes gene_type:complete
MIKYLLALFIPFIFSCENFTTKITNDTSVRVGTLENKLKYYIKNNTYPKDRIELLLVVNTGSIMENDNQQGLAHFAEHMAFNGTEKYPKQELVDYLESIGMKFGPDLNAYTSFDETVYMLQVPTEDKEIVSKGFEILYEWADKISFADEEIDKERGVVIEEWRLGRGAQERIFAKQIPVIFKDSKYAERLPIGKKDILETFDYQTIKDFYNDWYRSDLMAVVVVGDIDVDEAEDYIKKYFNQIELKENTRVRNIEKVPEFHNYRVAIASDKELRYPMIGINYMINPAEDKSSYNYYRNSIINELIIKMFNLRLSELTKIENPPFMFAGSYTTSGIIRAKTLFSIYAGAPEEKIASSFNDLLIETEKVIRHGFLQLELDRVKSSMLNDLQTAVNEKDKTESKDYRFKYKNNYLNGSPFLSQEEELKLFKEISPNITLYDLNLKVGNLFSANNKVFTFSMPEKEGLELITKSDVDSIYYNVASSYIKAYEEEAITEKLFDKDIKSGEILSHKELSVINAHELELSNGIKVVYKKTDFKNDEILFKAFSPGGHSKANDDAYISASQAADIISQSGLGSFDQITLDKFLSDKNASVSPYISELHEGFEGKSTNKDLELLFQLINLYFTEPNKDLAAFNTYKDRTKGFILNNSNNPERVFFDSVNVIKNNRHLRSMPLNVEKVDNISLDIAYDFYIDRFKNPDDFTFVFVGSIDESIFYSYINKYLSSIPKTNRQESWVDVGKSFPTKSINTTVYKGIEPKSFVYLGFGGPDEWSEFTSHKIKTLNHTVKIRLREILREDMGGTYGVWMWSDLQHYPKGEYNLNVLFGCSPENVDEMINVVSTKLDSFRLNGLNEKYLSKTKEMQLNELDKKLRENEYWLDELFSSYINNSTNFSRLTPDYKNVINSITNDDIKNLTNKYFSDKNLLKVILYPEK